MSASVPEIGTFELALTAAFVLVAGLASLAFRLGLGRDLLVGSARTFAQLFLMGYVLRLVFQLDLALLTLALFAVMLASAAHIVAGRVREREVPFALPMGVSMAVSYLVVTVAVCHAVIGAEPWWSPRVFLPIGGMVIGNSMNALAVALERLFSGLRGRRAEIEMLLSLGADHREASEDVVREAVRAGMIPSINSLMGVGLVFLPGMMTGQILAGADPAGAVRYQIVVMLMLVASTAISSVLAVLIVRDRCFGPSGRLVLRGG